MKRIVVRAAMSCAALLTAAPTQALGPYEHDEAAIVRVYCQRDGGAVTGTAFKVSTSGYITARHVTVGGVCFVAGQRVTMTSEDERTDYATFIGPESPAVLKASCGGFKAGRTYVARGYPGGGTYNIFAPWHALNMRLGLFQVFAASDSIPGMRGGPVIDEAGTVRGVVNMRWPARSMPLSRTGYCKP